MLINHDQELSSLVHNAQLPMYAPVDGKIKSQFVHLARNVVQVGSRNIKPVTGVPNRQRYWDSTQVIAADRL